MFGWDFGKCILQIFISRAKVIIHLFIYFDFCHNPIFTHGILSGVGVQNETARSAGGAYAGNSRQLLAAPHAI